MPKVGDREAPLGQAWVWVYVHVSLKSHFLGKVWRRKELGMVRDPACLSLGC